MQDYPRCDEEVRALAEELWGDCDGRTVKERAFGKGRVVWGITPRDILSRNGVVPDFSHEGGQSDAFVDWIHCHMDGTDIYFLANRKDRSERVTCSFRVAGKTPELWDPVTGLTRSATSYPIAGGVTNVPLEFSPHGSMFVSVLLLTVAAPVSRAAEAAAGEGRQTLSFDQARRFHLGEVGGGEKPETADADWRALDVPHDFSIEGPPGADPATMVGPFDQKSPGGTSAGALNGGVGWYRKTLTLPGDAAGKRVWVRFDGIYMDSEVWLNGVSLGKQPYGYTGVHF